LVELTLVRWRYATGIIGQPPSPTRGDSAGVDPDQWQERQANPSRMARYERPIPGSGCNR